MKISVHGNVLSRGGLRLEPHGRRVIDILAELLEIENVEVGRRLDQIHQSLFDLLIVEQRLKLGRDAGGFVFVIVVRGHEVLLLGDGHHLDEVTHGVLPVHGGTATAFVTPFRGAAINH